MVHEITHAAFWYCDLKGIDVKIPDNEERFCQIMGKMTSQIYDALFDANFLE